MIKRKLKLQPSAMFSCAVGLLEEGLHSQYSDTILLQIVEFGTVVLDLFIFILNRYTVPVQILHKTP